MRSPAALGWIYATFTAACAVSLWFAGMPTFDALAHALSTVSTGGFSTRDASVAAFDNANVEAVLVALDNLETVDACDYRILLLDVGSQLLLGLQGLGLDTRLRLNGKPFLGRFAVVYFFFQFGHVAW